MQVYSIDKYGKKPSGPIDLNGEASYTDVFFTVLEKLPSLSLTGGPWLAGGAVRRLVQRQERFNHNDFDIWFKNRDQYDQWVQWMSEQSAEVAWNSPNAITYNLSTGGSRVRIQLVHREFYEDAQAVINSFDFTMCQFLTDGSYLATGSMSVSDLDALRLVIRDPVSPVSTIRRIGKFTSEGFKISNSEIRDFLQRVAANPESIEVIFESDYEQEEAVQTR